MKTTSLGLHNDNDALKSEYHLHLQFRHFAAACALQFTLTKISSRMGVHLKCLSDRIFQKLMSPSFSFHVTMT